MSRAQTSATRVAIIPEVTEGTTPTTPAWDTMRLTGENLNVQRDTVQSDELDPTFNVKDLIVVGGRGDGGINFEFSPTTFDKIMEGALRGTWATNVVKNASVYKPFSVEATYEMGTVDAFKRHSGAYVNKLAFKMEPKKIITGNVEFLARNSTYDQAIVTGATYVAPTTTAPLSADKMTITTTGGFIATAVTSLTVDINNNMRLQDQLASQFASGVGFGDFDVTGDIEMYLDEVSYANLLMYVNNTPFGIAAQLGLTTLLKTKLNMPTCKLSDVNVTAEGKNGDVMIKAKYRALRDSGLNATMEITRLIV